jgi:glucan phosphoethanolaminetransferase (alkaline phosphatase superfamily)
MLLGNWFYQGGIFMWFILIADILAITVIVALLITYTKGRHKKSLIAIILVAALPMLIGASGHMFGYLAMMDALSSVDPANKQELYDVGMSVAMIPSKFGGVSSIVLLLLGLLGLRFR